MIKLWVFTLSIVIVSIIFFTDEEIGTKSITFPTNWSRPVKVLDVEGGTDFASAVIESAVPVIIKNTPAIKWPAMSKWNATYFVQYLPSMKVHVSKYHKVQMFSQVQPLGKVQGVEWKRAWEESTLKPHEFFKKRVKKENDDMYRYYYFMENLETFPLRSDIQSLDYLTIPWRTIWETNVWVGNQYMTTPAHYDVLHNFYVQISGYKRFVLFPPTESSKLYLFPRLHPSTRMSQIDLDQIDIDSYPDILTCTPQEVILGPGDVLYIPPYWFHHVTVSNSKMGTDPSPLNETNSIPPSISLSVHTESEQASVRDQMNRYVSSSLSNQFHTKSFLSKTDEIRLVEGLMFYIIQLFQDINTAQQFIRSNLIVSRYDHVSSHPDVEEGLEVLFKSSKEKFNQKYGKIVNYQAVVTHMKSLSSASSSSSLHDSIIEDVKGFNHIVHSWRNSPEFHIELANYIEDVVHYYLRNPLFVPPFLQLLSELN
eukprot:TRINITY_DN8188_c0_g1_i1.p1 TRINITY_DN8188_c0_g1~~TRINITY_DN8188_c0_g1_i1.p1  ORF type:complete len:482 (-),score=72.37 TRINITY_DN8188_c0_g1_i1:170-1615(-)